MNPVMMPELIWPCWAYAFRRVGYPTCILSQEWFKNELQKYLEQYNLDYLEKDNILVWKNIKEEIMYEPVKINTDGNIISMRISLSYHVGVYEGNGIVSDMIAPPVGSIPFVIRNRNLCDLHTPDFVITKLTQMEQQ